MQEENKCYIAEAGRRVALRHEGRIEVRSSRCVRPSADGRTLDDLVVLQVAEFFAAPVGLLCSLLCSGGAKSIEAPFHSMTLRFKQLTTNNQQRNESCRRSSPKASANCCPMTLIENSFVYLRFVFSISDRFINGIFSVHR